MLDKLIATDLQLFLFFNGMHADWADVVMYWLSDKFIWIPLYAWLLYKMLKSDLSNALWLILAIILLVVLTDQVSVHLFKDIFHRLRPCHNPALSGLVRTLHGKCGGQFGFISSHACNTAGIAVFTGLILKKAGIKFILPLLLLWSAAVSYSRIYLGVHYPGDVAVGFAVGAIIGWVVYIIYQRVSAPRVTRN